MICVNGTIYLTASEAPEHLGDDITPDIIRDWGRRRLATRYRVGRHTYYALDTLIDIERLTRTSARGRPRRAA